MTEDWFPQDVRKISTALHVYCSVDPAGDEKKTSGWILVSRTLGRSARLSVSLPVTLFGGIRGFRLLGMGIASLSVSFRLRSGCFSTGLSSVDAWSLPYFSCELIVLEAFESGEAENLYLR